ncbi:MAG: fruB1 [Solirubrobacterales bacterium]|nr:fruB1 [Solirubrobacterales bacterium]
MITLDASTVRLAASPATKEEAIRMVAALLADAGHIDPGYAESMLGREQVANTFLGEGIAIPHGLLKDRDLILSTGIGVVQVPGGVEWNPGETVRLVVGIAAASDEHLQILANLTQVLADEDEVAQLSTTTDAALVVDRLSRGPGEPAARTGGTLEFEALADHVAAEIVVDGAGGLHARPATAFVGVASGFAADVRVRSGEKVANGKSLASLLTLGAGPGARLTILAHGPDQEEALAALVAAVEAGLEEEDEHGADGAGGAPALTPPTWSPEGQATALPGIGASPGIAIGPLWHLKRRHLVVERHAKDPAVQERALRQAIESARAELRDLYEEVKAKSGPGKAAIFRAHEAFLSDPELEAEAVRTIGTGASAGWAWRAMIEARTGELSKVDDPLLAARAVDLGDVGQRVLRFLAHSDDAAPQLPEHPVILIADDLTPSDTAAIDPQRIVGFATALGGPTSHTAIIARALGIPAIVGAGPAVLAQAQNAPAVLDGTTGTLYLGLSDADLAGAQGAQADLEVVREAEHRTRFEPAIMRDGHRIEVVANVNRGPDAAAAVEEGAEGVGLMRTEFLFLGRHAPPDEEEQYEALAEMVRALNGLPLIVRTLDIGGDKNAPYIDLPHEDNSFLGVRGIRLCLERPELFAPQLRAIYRASLLGPVLIMFPMIARVEDLDAALEHAERARLAVGAEPIDVGIMIEVPSAAMLAPEFARRVQFFSVGTNDLTQYVLAMDRLHPVLAKQADALHPAVLRTIKLVTDAAEAEGVWVGVCGGVAGEPEGALILAGLGVRELSVSVPAVAAVKARLRTVDRAAVRALADRALACSTAAQVRELRLP